MLKTPPGTSAYTMYKDEQADPPALVCQVGSTTLKYHLRAIDDLHAWLAGQGDWVSLGAADEKKPAAPGTVEAWARSPDNPVAGWYGLRSGYRGRFGMYLPPLLEALGLAEVTHDPRTTGCERHQTHECRSESDSALLESAWAQGAGHSAARRRPPCLPRMTAGCRCVPNARHRPVIRTTAPPSGCTVSRAVTRPDD